MVVLFFGGDDDVNVYVCVMMRADAKSLRFLFSTRTKSFSLPTFIRSPDFRVRFFLFVCFVFCDERYFISFHFYIPTLPPLKRREEEAAAVCEADPAAAASVGGAGGGCLRPLLLSGWYCSICNFPFSHCTCNSVA